MAEQSRYHRQMLLPGVGEEGQQRIAAARVVIVGVGALGCSSADLLARAGVGHITLVDRDVVELTNLQRQTLFTEADVGTPKAEAARRRLTAANSAIALEAVIADFTYRNAETVALSAGRPAAIVDGTDNFETRYLINDLCVKHEIPFCYGGAIACRGMAATFVPSTNSPDPRPCLRCIFEQMPAPGTAPTCDTAGIFGPVISIVAACQAADALKVIVGADASSTLLDFDLWTTLRRRLDLGPMKNSNCPCCVVRDFEFLEGRHASDTASLCGQNAVQITPQSPGAIDLESLATRLRPHGAVSVSPFLLRATISPYELTIFRDGRAIIKGADKPEAARAIYAKYIGA